MAQSNVLLVLLPALMITSQGCYTQLATSDEEDNTVGDVIVEYYPVPVPFPVVEIIIVDHSPSPSHPKPDAPRRDFGAQRTEGNDERDGRRTGGGRGR